MSRKLSAHGILGMNGLLSSRFSRGVFLGLGGALLASGCLTRELGDADPKTTNLFVERQVLNRVDKIDLLFMIDNSISMADKQEMLKKAVPSLVERLIEPICVDAQGKQVPRGGAGACPVGSEPEFERIKDIHIGVISSSLGSNGGSACQTDGDPDHKVPPNPTNDDHGEQVSLRRGVTGPNLNNEFGYLEWKDGSNKAEFLDTFTKVISSVGESGCGYEASLESWYRFLIDPDPPTTVDKLQVNNNNGKEFNSTPSAPNARLLQQRAHFLRPDSLVAIIMLTDENDCSMMTSGQVWQWMDSGPAYNGTKSCDTDPNSACCRSCWNAETQPPAGCGSLIDDPNCAEPNRTRPTDDDKLNLRCFDQKRRYGYDLLFPTARYVDALTKTQVYNRAGQLVPNPLFARSEVYNNAEPRRPEDNLVYLAGIVGAPWQDLATPDSLDRAQSKLVYRRAKAPPGEGIPWEVLLGDPSKNLPPSDPFMIESIAERNTSAKNPITGAPILAKDSVNMTINGHEYDTAKENLQYACTYPLQQPVSCPPPPTGTAGSSGSGGPGNTGGAAPATSCDCKYERDKANPLCQPPSGGAETPFTFTQYSAKAFPGTRILQVLKDFGEKSIVASVCPKNSTDSTNQYYGYNPAVSAIVDQLKESFKGNCLPRPLKLRDDGRIACQVVEATWERGIQCTGDGREPLTESVQQAARAKLEEMHRCGGTTGKACDKYTLCGLREFGAKDPGRDACLTRPGNDQGFTGFCYIDATTTPAIGEPELVKACPATEKRMIRFLRNPANPIPAEKSDVITACLGDAIGSAAAAVPAPAP